MQRGVPARHPGGVIADVPASPPDTPGIPGWAERFLATHASRPEPTRVAATASGATLYRLGDAVAKVHRAGTDPDALALRVRACADPRTPLLAPLDEGVRTAPDGRAVTLWPWVEVLDQAEPDIPWTSAGSLLAGLHAVPAPAGMPAHGWVPRLRRALTRAPEDLQPLGRQLLREASCRDEPPVLLHGDWHLGQLGREEGVGWRLIDPDDVGVGHPAWDLARPAGFWAAGLLSDSAWAGLVDAYQAASGRPLADAWGLEGDMWEALDLPARCAVYVAAVSGRETGDTADALRDACLRMAE